MQLVVGLATIATFVVTIIWMYRIATNVRAFQRQTTWSPLFAIFGWMLPPFVLYVIPFLMLRELWKASDGTDPDDPESWRSNKDTPLVWAWFVLYGIAPVVLLGFSVGSFLDGGLASSGSLESLAKSLDDFGAISLVSGDDQRRRSGRLDPVRQAAHRAPQATDERALTRGSLGRLPGTPCEGGRAPRLGG